MDTDLAAAAASGQAVVVCQVVTGGGGVGKTQLAAGLAHRCWDTRAVDLLIWVTASSRSRVLTTYAQAALDLTGFEDPDPEQAAARLLGWLASTDKRWLIVLDDLTDPGVLRTLWPPVQTPVGRTVVTTRRRDASLLAGRHVVPVDLFTSAEARAYLDHKLARHPHLLDGAAELAADLGCLPLALAQAAAYMLDRNLSCARYRTRLADRRRRLEDLVPEHGALPDEHHATIEATWALSIDLADQLRPRGLARPLIQLAALLDPNGIPTAVFTTAAVCEHLSARRPDGRPVDADEISDGLHALHRLNLLTFDTDTVRAHALVQRAVREATSTDHHEQLATVAADALSAVWPAIDAATALIAALRANTTTLANCAEDLLWNPDGHPLLYRAGTSLLNAGLYTTAVTYWQHLTDQAERLLGAEHPHTLTARVNLATSYRWAGRTAEAITIDETVLADAERLLGVDHPDTLTARDNLAAAYWEAGRTADAITIEETVLAYLDRVLGVDHPATLNARANLAAIYRQAGPTADTITTQKTTLADFERRRGVEHPDTLTARDNLVNSHWRESRTAYTFTGIIEGTLVDDSGRRQYNAETPDTLIARTNLASSYWQAGRTTDAIGLLETVVTDSEWLLGYEDPNTQAAMIVLQAWREEI
ncbi:tetratricopeptide repeat protein [Micromonosporaceae bacterium Da 78-11]